MDGAVLACDSKETRANYYRFWPKVTFVGGSFVVLYAGNPTLGEVFARRVDSSIYRARRNGQIDRSKAAQLVDEVLLLLAKDAGEDAVKGRQIMIAGTADTSEVCLWSVDAGEIYLREMRNWECYGSGIDAAEMLMKDFYFPEVTTQQAIPLLACVIRSVSEICIDCGGPISVIIVDQQGIKKLTSGEVKSALKRLRPLLDRLRKELPRRVLRGEKVQLSHYMRKNELR